LQGGQSGAQPYGDRKGLSGADPDLISTVEEAAAISAICVDHVGVSLRIVLFRFVMPTLT
jgi:hypothetical protein